MELSETVEMGSVACILLEAGRARQQEARQGLSETVETGSVACILLAAGGADREKHYISVSSTKSSRGGAAG